MNEAVEHDWVLLPITSPCKRIRFRCSNCGWTIKKRLNRPELAPVKINHIHDICETGLVPLEAAEWLAKLLPKLFLEVSMDGNRGPDTKCSYRIVAGVLGS